MMKNPQSIWLTINPADTQDPIVQVLSGRDIDLGQFDALDEPPSSIAVASNPFASAAFFHLIVTAVLQCLLGICGYDNGKPIQREKGIFGNIDTYIGTVEAQGRGTLHLHMVLCLKGSVPSSQMKVLLLSEQFWNQVKEFICANVKVDLSGYVGAQVLTILKRKNVAFSHPIDPHAEHYEQRQRENEIGIARTVQVHQCGSACMKVTKSRLVCKCQAPFLLSDSDWVNEDGQCRLKRTYGYFNNWCPAILQSVCANHDIKLVLNGTVTKDLAWYITNYSTKKRVNSSNTSALLANTLAFHQRDEGRIQDLNAINKRLIQRCANTLS
jgi:hypothetical protein